MNQFETANGMLAPANIIIFRFVDTKQQLRDVLQRAKDEDALVVFTMINTDMVLALCTAAHTLGVKYVDLWGTLLEQMDQHLDASRMCAYVAIACSNSKRCCQAEHVPSLEHLVGVCVQPTNMR